MISAALTILSKLPWKWIGIALAVAAVLFGAYRWAYGRGYDSRNDEVAAITADRDTHKANAKKLGAAIKQQNAAVLALRADGDARVAAGIAALAEVRKASAGQRATIAALRNSAERTYADGAPCTVSGALGGAEGL